MLAYCLADGLTCGGAIFRRGEIFVLPSTMESEFGGLSPSQLATKQRKVYSKELFRFPTPDEILAGYQSGRITEEHCTAKEILLISKWKESEHARKFEASRTLRETIEAENPDLKEEEEETAFESVGGETEYPPSVEEEPKEEKPVVKPIPKKTARRTTTSKKKK